MDNKNRKNNNIINSNNNTMNKNSNINKSYFVVWVKLRGNSKTLVIYCSLSNL